VAIRLRRNQPGRATLIQFDFSVRTTGRILDRGRFEHLIACLPSNVHRAKGFVQLDGEAFLFNFVAGRTDLESFPADKTELVFIGPHLETAQDAIIKNLRSCET